MIGERINNYQIVSVLGEGGMGSVYLAEHPFMGRKAAIKVLRRELAEDRGLVERFMNEARAANAIGHPNIIDIIDVGLLPTGVPYLMMEFLDGESLSRRIERQRPMPIADAVEVAAQTASALAAAHEKNIVHRDLKPDNLFLIPDRAHPTGRIKVLDFGIAKLRGELSGSGARTQTGSIMGTPPYMSPEQCRGVDELDHRTDIYALGIILYEMLTGAPPFVSPGWGEVVHMHISQPPPPLRPRNPAVSPELERLVLRALAKQPAERWSSMGALEAALRGVPGQREALAGGPRSSSMNALGAIAVPSPPTTLRSATGQVTASPEPLIAEGPTPGGRSRKRLPALAIGGIALAGIAFAAFALRGRHAPESPALVAPTATAPAAPLPAAVAPPPPSPPSAVAAPAPPPIAIPAATAEVGTPPINGKPTSKPTSKPSSKPAKKVTSKPSRPASASETPPAAPTPSTSPPAAAPSTAAKKPDCNPNYYFDAQARKHFKPECF